MSQMNYTFLAKILLLGEYRVGKSSMVLRYVEDRFPGDYIATIGANFLVKSVNLLFKGKEYKCGLQIWDIGGHARTSEVGRIFFQGVSGAILVYDLTRKETLEKIPLWIERLTKSSPDSRVYLVGNKNDLADLRQTTKEEGQEVKDRLNMESFFETSAKTGDRIQEAFEDMARLLVESHHHKNGEN